MTKHMNCVRFRGTLGTARITMQLDLGFDDVVVPAPSTADYPTLLDLPVPRLRGDSRESVVAEKFEAMIALDVLNSGVKDFFDIWLLLRRFDFDGIIIARAMTETVAKRGTAFPTALTRDFANDASRQAQWQAFIRKSRLENAPSDFAEIVEAVAVFLEPITRTLAAGENFQRLWKVPRSWHGH